MSEFFGGARVHGVLEFIVRERQKIVESGSHPQVRLAVAGGEVMDIGGLHESRRSGDRGVESPGLPFQARKIAGETVIPIAFLGGGETKDEAAAAVAKGVQKNGAVVGRAEFGVQIEGVGIFRRREVEGPIAGRPCGRAGARIGLSQ